MSVVLDDLQGMEGDNAIEDDRCDAIMNCLVEEASMFGENWKDKFIGLDWKKVENLQYPDYIPLASALYDSVNFILTEHDSEIVVRGFQTKRGKFDYKKFLHDFFMKLQACEQFEELETCDRKSSRAHCRSGKDMWDVAKKKLNTCSAVTTFVAGASEKARHRALQYLIDAIGRNQVSRFGSEDVHITGSLDCEAFRSELRRVFGINLSKLEAKTLFEAFDIDGNGTVSSTEFNISFNQMLVEWRRRDRKEARERKEISARKQIRKQESMKRKNKQERSVAAGGEVGKSFQSAIYEQSVVRLSETIVRLLQAGDKVTLSIPDGFVSEWYVQRCFREQWNLQLSREEVRTICMKLRGEDDCSRIPVSDANQMASSPVDQVQTKLPNIATASGGSPLRNGHIADDSDVGGDMVLGKHVKTLIVHLKHFVSPKKAKKRGDDIILHRNT